MKDFLECRGNGAPVATAGRPVLRISTCRRFTADDIVILSRGCAAKALTCTKAVMTRLGLTLNEAKTSLKNACADPLGKQIKSRSLTEQSQDPAIHGSPGSEIANVFFACRKAIWGLGIFSGLSNILMLTGPFFMLQVYDRVLPSRSLPTLVGLAIIATMLFAFQGALDLIRSRINVRIGRFLDETLSFRVYDALVRLPLKTRRDGDGLQPLRDLDQVRGFLSSGGPSALFDLPWMPLYLAICFCFHFWIGVTALIGACLLVALTALTEMRTRAPTKAAAGFAMTRNALALAGRRNAEALRAMGMSKRVVLRWAAANRKYLDAHEQASDVGGGLGGISKVIRMILQSAVLGVGAYLVIQNESTPGIIIASSILTARALAPIELVIANWKGFTAARQAGQRLSQLLTLLPEEQEPMALPRPKESFAVDRVHVIPPAMERPVVTDVSFVLKSGQGLGVIGPSGSGKSSLARALVGVWQPARGRVRIDKAPLDQWSNEALGWHIGYLPQEVELFDDTIASNIARFDREADPAAVLDAARAAGVHELILSLPNGYGTRIGEGGLALSGGQRQRIALARALFGNPFLVVLDEPNSNLDAEGEEALTKAILSVRSRGGIAVVVAHRPSALAAVDHVLVLAEGMVQAVGAKEEVLRKVLRPASVPSALKAVSDFPGGGR
jgi:PrtD family type I secretion system ABC transporter